MDNNSKPKNTGEEAPQGFLDPQMPHTEEMLVIGPATQAGLLPANVSIDTNLGADGSIVSGPPDPKDGSKRRNRCGSAKKRARKAKAELALQLAADAGNSSSANNTITLPLGGSHVGSNNGGGGDGGSGVSVACVSKRRRDEDSTPPEIRKVVKKNKGGALPMSFSEAAQADKRLAIVPVDYPVRSLGHEEGSLLSRALLAAMDVIPNDLAVPRFEGNRWERGALWVTCADDRAKEWLTNIVPSLRPWENAALKVLEKEKIPKLKKMTAVFRDTTEEVGAVLRRLVRSNPVLKTEMWKVWEAKPAGKNLQLILGVDEGSVAELAKLSFAPYFGLGRAQFQEVQPKTEKGKPPSAGPRAVVGAQKKAFGQKGAPGNGSPGATVAPATGPGPRAGGTAVAGSSGLPSKEHRSGTAAPAPRVEVLIRPPRLQLDEGPSGTNPIKGKAGRPSLATLATREALAETMRGTQTTLSSFKAGPSPTPQTIEATGETPNMEVEEGQ